VVERPKELIPSCQGRSFFTGRRRPNGAREIPLQGKEGSLKFVSSGGESKLSLRMSKVVKTCGKIGRGLVKSRKFQCREGRYTATKNPVVEINRKPGIIFEKKGPNPLKDIYYPRLASSAYYIN